ncbi:hypothetical protein SO802_032798 [Lithocarpus litseifolius]|uniref:Uncharacterized protein n=1 Tax=Lithocarpus litseifolius TaxID=425828 RepID=A0AAW2BCL3_9ROSI
MAFAIALLETDMDTIPSPKAIQCKEEVDVSQRVKTCARCSRQRSSPLVVVVDVLCFGFALLDESVALVSLALIQSLLLEACGRTVNPMDGFGGLLARGKWHVCQMVVDTVLVGGTLTPLTEFETLTNGIFHYTTCNPYLPFTAFMQDA